MTDTDELKQEIRALKLSLKNLSFYARPKAIINDEDRMLEYLCNNADRLSKEIVE